MAQSDWIRLLETERMIQKHFPEAVLVGGTAAALHANHPGWFDVDSVPTDLRHRFPEVLAELESLAGWTTRRTRLPVLILGNLQGIDVGIRQLIRSAPLDTTTLQGITIPTVEEMLRIKGWLIVTRNALRDYLDFCALGAHLGSAFEKALQPMDTFYPQPADADAASQQLAKMLAEPLPFDFRPGEDRLTVWRELQPPWTDWSFVTESCRQLAARLFNSLMES